MGVTAATDVALDSNGVMDVEESTSVMVAYRHFWTETLRSSVYYGNTTTDLTDRDRSHVAVNLFTNVTKQLSFGIEVGNFDMAEQNADSTYVQFSTKFVL